MKHLQLVIMPLRRSVKLRLKRLSTKVLQFCLLVTLPHQYKKFGDRSIYLRNGQLIHDGPTGETLNIYETQKAKDAEEKKKRQEAKKAARKAALAKEKAKKAQ